MSRFEWMVALRYLRAKRKQTVISVITVISVLGIAAGVTALIIALAITNGFETTLQGSLLSATAHVNVLSREPDSGIEHWQELIPKLSKIRHVVSATPGLYGPIAIKGPFQGAGAEMKGVPIGRGAATPELLKHLKAGSLAGFTGRRSDTGIVLGARLAEQIGVRLHSPVSVVSYRGQLTPLGPTFTMFRFRVEAIFESGLYDLDNMWAFSTLPAAQRVLDLDDVVNTIELRLDDVFAAREVAAQAETACGKEFVATTWMEQNRALLNALRLEKIVSVITVGLIELVAALNILVVLVMLVMEKHRDIAILMAVGARREQIRRIFMLQGLMIAGVGSAIGLVVGFGASTLCDRYRWLRLDEQIYALSYVPFQSHWTDGVWVAGIALATSLLATLHPAWTASRIAPAEALRYE